MVLLEEKGAGMLQPHKGQLTAGRYLRASLLLSDDGNVQQHLPLGLVFSCFRRVMKLSIMPLRNRMPILSGWSGSKVPSTSSAASNRPVETKSRA